MFGGGSLWYDIGSRRIKSFGLSDDVGDMFKPESELFVRESMKFKKDLYESEEDTDKRHDGLKDYLIKETEPLDELDTKEFLEKLAAKNLPKRVLKKVAKKKGVKLEFFDKDGKPIKEENKSSSRGRSRSRERSRER